MGEEERKMLPDQLAFFGKITASLSHEINNVVSIISQSGGLLEDMALMAERERPMDVERVKRECGRISSQVSRGKDIIKMLNRFAHSVDDLEAPVDLNNIALNAARLNQRFAELKKTTIDFRPSAEPLMVMTKPYFLYHLLTTLIGSLLDNDLSHEPVNIVVSSDSNEIKVLVARKGRWNHDQALELTGGLQALADEAAFELKQNHGNGSDQDFGYLLRNRKST